MTLFPHCMVCDANKRTYPEHELIAQDPDDKVLGMLCVWLRKNTLVDFGHPRSILWRFVSRISNTRIGHGGPRVFEWWKTWYLSTICDDARGSYGSRLCCSVHQLSQHACRGILDKKQVVSRAFGQCQTVIRSFVHEKPSMPPFKRKRSSIPGWLHV